MSLDLSSAYGTAAWEVERIGDGAQGLHGFYTSGAGVVTTSAGLTVAYAAIPARGYVINGVLITTGVVAGTIAVDAAHATQYRRDVIYVDNTGTVGKTTGTIGTGATPTTAFAPTPSATQLPLAAINVAPTVTSIGSSDIEDKRQILACYFPEMWLPAVPALIVPTLSSLITNQAYLVPMEPVERPVIINTLKVNLGGSTDDLDAGIYSYDGTTFTLVVSIGSTAFPGTGAQSLNIADTQLTPGGRYFSGIAANGTSLTISGFSNTLPTLTIPAKGTSFPLPATIVSPTTATVIPIIYGIVAGGTLA